MMWDILKIFRKKEKITEKVVKEYIVPDEEVQEVFRLVDRWRSLPLGSDHEAKYLLYKKIYSIFPELDRNGNNTISMKNAMRIVVEVTEAA